MAPAAAGPNDLKTHVPILRGKGGGHCAPSAFQRPVLRPPGGPYQKKKTYFTDKKGRAKTDTVLGVLPQDRMLYSGYWEQEGTVEIDEAQNTVEFEGFANPCLPASNFARACRNGGTLTSSAQLYNAP